MQSFKYEYQSHFAKLYIAQGRVDIITRQLGSRFGEVSEAVNAQIASCSGEELNAIADRLLTAATLQEALAPKS
jgi:hypothetical protein